MRPKGSTLSTAQKAKISAGHRAIPAARKKALADAIVARKTKHGHAGSRSVLPKLFHTPTYDSWAMIKARCYNPRASGYSINGGLGVVVCDRWLGADGFANFLRDMGVRPRGTTIKRVDDDGDYEPGNCRWAASRGVARRGLGGMWGRKP